MESFWFEVDSQNKLSDLRSDTTCVVTRITPVITGSY